MVGATWDEIKGEAEAEKTRNKILGAAVDDSGLDMWGFRLSDLPPSFQGAAADLVDAKRRVELVLRDEWAAVQAEAAEGTARAVDSAVGWDGKEAMAQAASYPGARRIQDYEMTDIESATVKQYSYESIVFSFVLIAAVGKFRYVHSVSGACFCC